MFLCSVFVASVVGPSQKLWAVGACSGHPHPRLCWETKSKTPSLDLLGKAAAGCKNRPPEGGGAGGMLGRPGMPRNPPGQGDALVFPHRWRRDPKFKGKELAICTRSSAPLQGRGGRGGGNFCLITSISGK